MTLRIVHDRSPVAHAEHRSTRPAIGTDASFARALPAVAITGCAAGLLSPTGQAPIRLMRPALP